MAEAIMMKKAGGVDDIIAYATNGTKLFYRAVIPSKEELVLSFSHGSVVDVSNMFTELESTTLKRIKINNDITNCNGAFAANYNAESAQYDEIYFISAQGGTFGDMFRGQKRLKTIHGVFSPANNMGGGGWGRAFEGCNMLETVRFAQNSLKYAPDLSSSNRLTADSLVSLSNGLLETLTGNVVLNNTSKTLIQTILGVVNLDPSGTYHIFTQDTIGTVTLYDFITTIKGWTLG